MNPEPFDREWSLAELLPATGFDRLGEALNTLLGEAALLDGNGQPYWGTAAADAPRQPLILELEPLGWLVSGTAPSVDLAAAALWVEALLRAGARYRMAPSLHLEAVQSDFEKLRAEHGRLQLSETRYRELAAELEQRVQSQVRLLDERQRQLYQAEKLASVGQLAAGVAHEINNPIGFVRGNLGTFGKLVDILTTFRGRIAEGEAAWRELDLDFLVADGADLVTESISGIDRVARIVKDLKGFSNVDGAAEEFADINLILADVCHMAEKLLPPGVSLERGGAEELPRVLCLPGHLAQVFLALVVNAAQATTALGKPGVVRVASRAAANGVEITVSDRGVGMKLEQLKRAFEPFYTTRAVGEGVGLGLTVARDVVQAHGGHIDLASTLGEGTTVTVFLPL